MKLASCILRFGLAMLVSTQALFCQSVAPETPPRPEHAATVEQVHEYYQLAGLQKLLQALMTQMVDGMRLTSKTTVPESVWNQMQRDFTAYDFEAVVTPAYQRYISREDMAATLLYMKSPEARRMKASEPYIEQMIGEVSKRAGREIGEKAARDHMDEIIALQKQTDAAAAERVGTKPSEQPTIVIPKESSPAQTK